MTARYWDTVHYHNYPWSQVASAYWSRYPNPNSQHVFSEDFVECHLREDERNSGKKLLYTKRFISKTNSLPSWGEHFFRTRRVAMTEEAVIDPEARTLTTYTRNIGDLRFWMGVTETVVFRQDPADAGRTVVEKRVWIESDMFGFRSAIKKFGIDRFKKNCVRATEGFEWVLNKIYSANSSSSNSNNINSATSNSAKNSSSSGGNKIRLSFPNGGSGGGSSSVEDC